MQSDPPREFLPRVGIGFRQAFKKGWRAQVEGKPIDVCPYEPSTQAGQRFHRFWIAGYQKADQISEVEP